MSGTTYQPLDDVEDPNPPPDSYIKNEPTMVQAHLVVYF